MVVKWRLRCRIPAQKQIGSSVAGPKVFCNSKYMSLKAIKKLKYGQRRALKRQGQYNRYLEIKGPKALICQLVESFPFEIVDLFHRKTSSFCRRSMLLNKVLRYRQSAGLSKLI
jgi:hypothetical protein